jgi:hypothetical protein
MHIELAPKYASGLKNIIESLGLEAHIINSFNAGGETITLSVSKDEIDKILQAEESDFVSTGDVDSEYPPVTLEGLKAILRDQLADRV